MTVQLVNYKAQEYVDEYMVDGTVDANKKFHFFKFFIRAHFYKPDIKWTKDLLQFHISRTKISLKEKVGLRNNTLLSTKVKLIVEGNYVILNNIEAVKKLTLEIPPSSTKVINITVMFEEGAINYEEKLDEMFDGKIVCIANKKDKMNPLLLKTHVIFPLIKSKFEKYTFFTPNVPFHDHIIIENERNMETSYEIRLIKTFEFIHNQVSVNLFSFMYIFTGVTQVRKISKCLY